MFWNLTWPVDLPQVFLPSLFLFYCYHYFSCESLACDWRLPVPQICEICPGLRLKERGLHPPHQVHLLATHCSHGIMPYRRRWNHRC